MKKIIMILVISSLALNVWAQKKTVKIITSAQCVRDCCKERIEEEMQFTRGVIAANLEIESGVLLVTFREKKTDIEKIRRAISLIGYNADDVRANKEAHGELPHCCQHLEFIDPEN